MNKIHSGYPALSERVDKDVTIRSAINSGAERCFIVPKRFSPKRKAIVRNYHHGNLAADLKEATLALIRKRGPKGFTLNEAAMSAGVAASAPYRHFQDKEALLVSLAVDGNELLAADLAKAAARCDQPLEAMIAIGVAYVDFALLHRDYFDIMFNSGIDPLQHPALFEVARRSFEVGVSASRKLTGEPQMQADIALAMWTLVHGIATLRNQNALSIAGAHGGESITTITRRLLTSALSGLLLPSST